MRKLKTLFALLVLSFFTIGNVWATTARITNPSNIATGKNYYIGATVSSTDYYFKAKDGIEASDDALQGTSTTTPTTDGAVVTISGSGSAWTMQFVGGDYLTLASTKENAKYRCSETAATWAFTSSSSLINMKINNYCLMKNSGNSLNFGSYSSGQTNVWLEPALKVSYNANDAESGTVPTDATYYLSGSTVTAKANTGNLAKDGYTFVGWNTKADGTGTNISGTFSITQDTILYAKWVEAVACDNKVTITNSVTTNVTNGSFTVNLTGEQEACLALSVIVTPTPASEHCHIGTVSATNPSTTGTAGEAVDNGDGTYTITYSENAQGNTTINVTFTEDTKYTINFLNNGEAAHAAVEVYEGEKIGDKLPTLTSDDACHATITTFAGWTTEDVGGNPVHTIDTSKLVDKWTVPTSNLTLKALWATIPTSATTTFAAADYSAATAPLTKEKDNIKFYFDAGQIYKSNTPYTFTITSGNHYFSITAKDKVVAKLATVCNDGTYCLNSVSDGTLSPNSSTASQTVNGINSSSVECYPKSSSQIRMQTCAVYCYDNYITECCNALGEIDGVVALTQIASGENARKLKATWTMASVAGLADNGLIIKIYEDGNATPVHTSSALAKATEEYTATGFAPKTCTEYYATLTTVRGDDASYCEGFEQGQSENVATAGYTYTINKTNVVLKEGEGEEANTCVGDLEAVYVANAGYNLPETITVTNAGEEGTGWLWDNSDGSLLVYAAYVTDDVVVTITGVEDLTPVITVSKTEVDFQRVKQGDEVSTTFTVEGAHLSNNIKITSDNDVFTVDKGTLTINDGSVALTTITLTANTEVADDYVGTITISDGEGGATDKSIDVYMTVRELYTVNWYINGSETPFANQTDTAGVELEIPDDFSSFTNCSSFYFIGWKDGSAIAGGSSTTRPDLANVGTEVSASKNYYAVFAEGTPGSTTWSRVTAVNTLTAGGTFMLGYEGDPANAKGTIVPMRNTGSMSTSATGYIYSGNGTGTQSNDSQIKIDTVTSTSKYEFTVAASEEVDGAINIKFGSNFVGNENEKNCVKLYNADANTTAFTPTLGTNDAFTLEIEANTSGSAYKYFKYNTGAPRFAVYSTEPAGIVFYKKTVTEESFTKFYTTCPSTPTALDNMEIGKKAVKKIVNGQLLIESNGHIYNAQGQLVK